CATLVALAPLLILTLLGLMSTITTALIFAEANPAGEDLFKYDGPLSILAEGPYPSATEAEEPSLTADGLLHVNAPPPDPSPPRPPYPPRPPHPQCNRGYRLC
ncbi:hypothetical protein BGW39_003385, partial [Mortierella sp. 14UC]